MYISSMGVRITDIHIPYAGVGTVFNGKLRTLRWMAVGGMTSSASQISCLGIAMTQDFQDLVGRRDTLSICFS